MGAFPLNVGPAGSLQLQRRQQFRHPAFNRHAHFAEMAFEEMISGNEHQLLRIGGLGHNLLQQRVRAVLITIAADEELRLSAITKKLEYEYNRPSASTGVPIEISALHIGIRASCAQSGGRAERKSGEEDGQRELAASARPARTARPRSRHALRHAVPRSIRCRES